MKLDCSATIILENERALLRPLSMADFPALLPIAMEDPLLVQYSSYRIHTDAFLKNFMLHALKERDAGTRYAFTVFDKEKKVYAGSTSLGNISNRDQRLEIGWTWLGKSFQGTGLNTRCKALLLNYAFDTLHFQRVEFKTDERNAVSRKAIEKLGAIYEGTLRNHMGMPDGGRRNTVYYSILKNEWSDIKSRISV